MTESPFMAQPMTLPFMFASLRTLADFSAVMVAVLPLVREVALTVAVAAFFMVNTAVPLP